MAATISVDLNARIANFETEMKKATGSLDRFGTKTKSIGDSIGRNLGLGISAVVVGFGALAKSTLDSADNLKDMSTRLGVSVNDLASFKLAADQSGSSLENVGIGIARLTKSIGLAEAGNKQMSEALTGLGITARDPKEAFFQLADAVKRIEDPSKRAALLSAVLGKSYADLIPLLSEGGAGLRKSAQESENFADAMARLAPHADQFNDNLAKLKLNLATLTGGLLQAVVPLINDIAEAMRNATGYGDGFLGLFAALKNSGVSDSDIGQQIDKVSGRLKILRADLNDLSKPGLINQVNDFVFGDVHDLQVQISVAEKELALLTKRREDLSPNPTKPKKDGKINPPVDTGVKKDPQGDFVKKLKEEAEVLGLSGEALLQYQAKKLGLAGANKKLADGFIQQITAFKFQEESMKGVVKLFDDQDAAIGKSVDSLRSWIAEQTFEASLLGMTSSERESAIKLRELETAGIYKESEAYKELKKQAQDASDLNALNRMVGGADFTKIKQDQADMIVLAKAFTDGIKDANGELMKLSEEQYLDAVVTRLGLAKDSISEMDEFAKNAVKGIQSAFADFLFDPFKDGLSGMIAGFGQMIQKMIAEAVAADLMKRLFGDLAGGSGSGVAGDLLGSIARFFKFADGGIMTSKGSIPLNKYAGGGIANSPQLALFGEGRMNEAFIPLPDGRSVPVTMQGGGGKTNITVVVQGGQSAPDVRRAAAQGAREALGLMSASQRYA